MDLAEIAARISEELFCAANATETTMSCQQFFAMQDRERRAFLAQKVREGALFYGAGEADHDLIMAETYRTVHLNRAMKVAEFLEALGLEKGYPAEWAAAVAGQSNSKKMRKTFREYEDHPVTNDLRRNGMYTQTHKSALQAASYIGKAELLFSGSQAARRLQRLEEQAAEHTQQIQELQVATQEAKARLNSLEDWKEKAEALYAQGRTPEAIARELGRARSTVAAHLRKQSMH